MTEFYSVTITKHDDPDAEASFRIEPPVRFVSPEMRHELVEVVRKLIINRMGEEEAEFLKMSITHDLPDGSATVGRAHFKGLELGTGAVVLQQALELGLNGTNQYISPSSPLHG